MSRSLIVAPSVLAADFGRLAEEVRAADAGGGDWIHVDIMDGRFVPEISFGPPVVRAIRAATSKPLNVHLMIVEAERALAAYAEAGADHLIVHAEPAATIHLNRTLALAAELGCTAGVAINPATPVAAIEHVLDMVGTVLVMTVNPGFGGQRFLPAMLGKVAALRALADARGLDLHIEVDGGMDAVTTRAVAAAGADVIVAGTSVFGRRDAAGGIAAAIGDIRQAGAAQ